MRKPALKSKSGRISARVRARKLTKPRYAVSAARQSKKASPKIGPLSKMMRVHSFSESKKVDWPIRKAAPPLVPTPRPKPKIGAWPRCPSPSVNPLRVRWIKPPVIVVSAASADSVNRLDKILRPSCTMGRRVTINSASTSKTKLLPKRFTASGRISSTIASESTTRRTDITSERLPETTIARRTPQPAPRSNQLR